MESNHDPSLMRGLLDLQANDPLGLTRIARGLRSESAEPILQASAYVEEGVRMNNSPYMASKTHIFGRGGYTFH